MVVLVVYEDHSMTNLWDILASGIEKKGLPDVTHEIHGTEGVQARNSWLVGGFKHFWNCP